MTIDALGFIPAPIAEDFSIQHDSSESLLTGKTFADIAIFAKAVPGFTKKQCDDARSALRMLFKKTGTHPGDVPLNQPEAALDGLFHRLDAVLVAPKGPAKRNIKSRCRTVMRRYLTYIGYVAPVPPPPPMAPVAWQRVAKAMPQSTGFSPKRFIGFCTARDLAPADVDDMFVDEFAATLGDLKHPRVHLRDLIRAWNHIVCPDSFPDLRILSKIASRRSTYSARLEELSLEMQADITAYIKSRQGSRPIRLSDAATRRSQNAERRRRPRKQLRESSAGKSLQLIRQYLGFLCEDGVNVAEFRCLKDAVTPEFIDRATEGLQRRTGAETSSQLNNMLFTLSAMAGNWLDWNEDERVDLHEFCADHRHEYTGMTERNVARLLVLQDPRRRRDLLHLPFTLFKLATNCDSERGAYLAQIGLAIELLLQVPMRVGTLSRLRWGHEIVLSGTGRHSSVFLLVPREGVKNGEPIRAELPHETVELLQLYWDRYRPRLRNTEGPYLFPGEEGGHKSTLGLSNHIKNVIREHTGLDINAHLFRAIAAFIYLKYHPGDLRTVAAILGDRNLAVVQKHYDFLDQIQIRRDYQRTLLTDRRAQPAVVRGRQ